MPARGTDVTGDDAEEDEDKAAGLLTCTSRLADQPPDDALAAPAAAAPAAAGTAAVGPAAAQFPIGCLPKHLRQQ